MKKKQSYQFQRFQDSIQRKQKSVSILNRLLIPSLAFMLYLSYQILFVPLPQEALSQDNDQGIESAQQKQANPSASKAAIMEQDQQALVWWLNSENIPSANILRDCLWGLGDQNVEVIGDKNGFLINRPKQKKPQIFSLVDGTYWIKTYLDQDIHAKVTEHLYVAICLKSENASLKDPKNEREWKADNWPKLGQSGGVNLNDLIAIKEQELDQTKALKTQGFEALGLNDIIVLDQSPLAKQLLQNIAVLKLINPTALSFEWQKTSFELQEYAPALDSNANSSTPKQIPNSKLFLLVPKAQSLKAYLEQQEVQESQISPSKGTNVIPTSQRPKSKIKGNLIPNKSKPTPSQEPVEIPVFKPDYQ